MTNEERRVDLIESITADEWERIRLDLMPHRSAQLHARIEEIARLTREIEEQVR